jgi:hypothetical protein
MEIIIEGYQQDTQAKQLLTELSLCPQNDKGYSLVDGILKHKGRIWLGNTMKHTRPFFQHCIPVG